MLNNIKTNKSDKGFTIVELLIVIVVIAILAAITIVAYNGIQNRAKATSGQNLASQIAKKAETYNTLTSVYPTHTQLTGNSAPSGYTGSLTEAKLDQPSSVISAALTESGADSGKVVSYTKCTTNGARVYWWDFTKTSGQLTTISIGDTATC